MITPPKQIDDIDPDEGEYDVFAAILNWDDYRRMIENNEMAESGAGTGRDCRNLKEAGWNGYDSDREEAFEVVDPASLGIQDFRP